MPKKKTTARSQGQTRSQIVLREADRRNADELAQVFGISTIGDVVRLSANMLAGKIAHGDAPAAAEVGYQPDDTPASQTTIWLRPQDRGALDAVQRHYGIESFAATVRFCIAWLGWFFAQTKFMPPHDPSRD
jgi:hypothetical protein